VHFAEMYFISVATSLLQNNRVPEYVEKAEIDLAIALNSVKSLTHFSCR